MDYLLATLLALSIILNAYTYLLHGRTIARLERRLELLDRELDRMARTLRDRL